jgi:hypothetical protein
MLPLILCPPAGWQDGWKQFTSAAGFSVMYPAKWRRIGISEDRLDIVSSEGHQEGVVIQQGEAEIIVRERPEAMTSTLAELTALDSRSDSVLSRRELPGQGAHGESCRVLTEVVTKFEIGPGTYNIGTSLYCELRGRKFTTDVRNWEGDKRQPEYQRIALRMAQSLRIVRQA